jgi:hypothetical protein
MAVETRGAGTLVTPWVGVRVLSALTTTAAALITAILIFLPGAFVLWATSTRPSDAGVTSAGAGLKAFPLDFQASQLDGQVPVNPVVAAAVYLAIAIGVVLVTSRAGRGSIGDAVCHLTAIDAQGAPVARWRNVANSALPVLVWALASALANPRLALLAVLMLWLPALVRHDRRSVYSLITGTHYGIPEGFVLRKRPKQPPVKVDGQWRDAPR